MTYTTPTGHAKSGMWNGTRNEGERFTEQQKLTMMQRRGSLDGWDVKTVQLQRPREPNSADIAACRPREHCFDLVTVECPILSRGLEHDVIITPGGDEYRAPVARRRK